MNKISWGLGLAVLTVMSFASGAFAQETTTPAMGDLNDSLETGAGQIETFMTTGPVPIIITLIILGIVIRLVFRWLKKAGRAVGA